MRASLTFKPTAWYTGAHSHNDFLYSFGSYLNAFCITSSFFPLNIFSAALYVCLFNNATYWEYFIKVVCDRTTKAYITYRKV